MLWRLYVTFSTVHFLEIRRSSRRRVSESVDIVLHKIKTLGEILGSEDLSSFMISVSPSSALYTWTEALSIASEDCLQSYNMLVFFESS